ncbi:16S rRNA (guanine(966)-N(2))-methyltransferase RsmD [Arcanobacterium haemolyticum]|uniref:Methyltransferase n=1 Tax=Arcanobacterium haemolyticum (strain ATCC 9345 / DSM 20595 / CCM 5947 / CCUG 17215 / LMG 16163 / NBRC 15585 / NCTC 8452 / 11018) TaxID=644284 RepID=D7BPE9_ARCHD|nr:16S rRNA (guanine(966)-N(2))-methyltransferase RsmD [Arcanobacterium haemolyticum]ADH92798.1 methyltransferase [Arcanobacterium haemolyticum DSM 20595]QCX46888.1 16S rRNA (guanine(966)-N(2))-methyltransferase RsmD [Arcanobacterium haemolyticum]SPT74642.1 Ribosomal RNA small subunit methyltransferase D [Arcanobacterium haemolyticum]SQH28454.1 Ribosomal RNA small subunit methyltransferase D [Arcanobacterium haemolyticum]
MSRIVAGSARGRSLKVPKSGTRPTSSRVREALFSHLEHRDFVDGCDVLDLFAGSGALALEALSRGATRAIGVDSAEEAIRAMNANARETQLPLKAIKSQVLTYVSQPGTDGPFDVIILDPPYDFPDDSLTAILHELPRHLKSDGLVVVERAKRCTPPTWPEELAPEHERTWGDTRIWTAQNTADQEN